MKANFHRPEVTNLVVTPTFTTTAAGSFQLTLVAIGKVPTTFAAMWTADHDDRRGCRRWSGA